MTTENTSPPALVPADLPALATEINSLHDLGEASARRALEHFRDCGLALMRAREACAYGEWLPWLRANVTFSVRTAYNYILVAENWTRIATVANLREALELLTSTPPLPVSFTRSVPEPEPPRSIPSTASGETPPPRKITFTRSAPQPATRVGVVYREDPRTLRVAAEPDAGATEPAVEPAVDPAADLEATEQSALMAALMARLETHPPRAGTLSPAVEERVRNLMRNFHGLLGKLLRRLDGRA
jgi:hypothetical protein